ncbi:MAG: MdtA/MuxA family multidrug efflux RND transporter periplasmic adaptor subunit [Acidobacteriota bacterium]|nr:MdtA/MuxA family multidrug efflux RND transporter periplasmic adaptor subunit [Acidobacteriota bacterium]
MTTNTTTSELHETTRRPRKRGLIWMVLLLAVAGVAGYAVWRASKPDLIAVPAAGGGRGRGRGAGGGGLGPIPVVIAKAKAANVPVYLTGIGNASAFYTVIVKTRVDGQLMSVNFKEGDYVKQNQVLAEIDPRPYQVQLEMAEGTQARDQALLANARLDLQRYQTLLAQDAIPKQQLDTQVATLGQIEGNLKTDQANISSARLNLTYAQIIAPISGRIGLRLVDPGNIVHASDANGLFVITQLQPISALFTVPEDSLPQVMGKIRAGVHLPVDAFNRDNSAKLDSGTLVTADNQVDPSTGTSKMKAVFPNTNNALFPNQFLNMRVLVDTKRNEIVVPSVAIQHGQQGPFVFLVGADSRVKMQNVVPDIALDNDTTSLSSGLSDGDAVVVDGTDRLQNGSAVRIRRPGDDGMGAGGGRGGRGRGGRGAASGTAPGGGAPGTGGSGRGQGAGPS